MRKAFVVRSADYDLTRPADNLRIGFHHFARLLALLQSIPQALLAYNAGLSRVRSWQRAFPALPPDMLVEVIPYDETRHYVRKVLVSVAAYDWLYEDRSERQAVDLFYPALSPGD